MADGGQRPQIGIRESETRQRRAGQGTGQRQASSPPHRRGMHRAPAHRLYGRCGRGATAEPECIGKGRIRCVCFRVR
jgi:hypothetical protein